jgi:hypothetical protein
VIVSPEFALHDLSHAHNGTNDLDDDAFESYIALAFSELSGYVPPQPVPSIAPSLPPL